MNILLLGLLLNVLLWSKLRSSDTTRSFLGKGPSWASPGWIFTCQFFPGWPGVVLRKSSPRRDPIILLPACYREAVREVGRCRAAWKSLLPAYEGLGFPSRCRMATSNYWFGKDCTRNALFDNWTLTLSSGNSGTWMRNLWKLHLSLTLNHVMISCEGLVNLLMLRPALKKVWVTLPVVWNHSHWFIYHLRGLVRAPRTSRILIILILVFGIFDVVVF